MDKLHLKIYSNRILNIIKNVNIILNIIKNIKIVKKMFLLYFGSNKCRLGEQKRLL